MTVSIPTNEYLLTTIDNHEYNKYILANEYTLKLTDFHKYIPPRKKEIFIHVPTLLTTIQQKSYI